MTLLVEPEIGVPYSPELTYLDLRDRAVLACNTAALLSEYGLQLQFNEDDAGIAREMTIAYAGDPTTASKAVSNSQAAKMRPEALMAVATVLRDFGHEIAADAAQVRNIVTNKLLIETENPDARIRIRALELLGKIRDVGLFSDRSEVTVTHQTSSELRSRLKTRLQTLIAGKDGAEDGVVIAGDVVDVDAELGLPTRRTEATPVDELLASEH